MIEENQQPFHYICSKSEGLPLVNKSLEANLVLLNHWQQNALPAVYLQHEQFVEMSPESAKKKKSIINTRMVEVMNCTSEKTDKLKRF